MRGGCVAGWSDQSIQEGRAYCVEPLLARLTCRAVDLAYSTSSLPTTTARASTPSHWLSSSVDCVEGGEFQLMPTRVVQLVSAPYRTSHVV